MASILSSVVVGCAHLLVCKKTKIAYWQELVSPGMTSILSSVVVLTY